ncbi:MAG: IS630 family transposase, partial [Patescibacteria group bacterium]
KQSPSEYGLPKEFWDIPILKRYVKAEFGTVYESRQSYYFLLKFSNLSFKLPDKFDIRRNETLINQRIEEIRVEIKEYLNNNQWEVFASDEARIQLEAITRKAWLKKGEKTILKVQRSNEYQNYIGMLNHKNNKCHIYELEWQNQDEIIKALKIFIKNYPNKRICIVWDNAKFHKGKLIRENLRKGQSLERLHLINFPPYAPDKNPVEHVWKEAKHKISNYQFQCFNKTKQAFKKSIVSRKFNYQI